MITIPCVLFAGGKSSRMGEDKALLPFGKFPTLTQFQHNRLQKYFSHVYISCKDSSKFSFDASFIEDFTSRNLYAPTAGFVSAFAHLATNRIFVISVDTPFISENEINKLLGSDNDDVDATIATLNSKVQPMCGIYHRSLENHFIKMMQEDNHKLGFLLKNINTKYVDFSHETPFLNLNHPSDYHKALNLFNTSSL